MEAHNDWGLERRFMRLHMYHTRFRSTEHKWLEDVAQCHRYVSWQYKLDRLDIRLYPTL